MLTGRQLRAARALLGITAEQLASLAQLGVATIRRAEADDGMVNMTASNAHRVVEALEAQGVEFIPRDAKGEGVRAR